MLRKASDLCQNKIEAADGRLGQVKDLLFDFGCWIVRYAVVDTRRWLPGRKVLVAPAELGRPKDEADVLPVQLTKQQIRESPTIHAHEPVSRQHAYDLYSYYGWPCYWWATPPSPQEQAEEAAHDSNADEHLCSWTTLHAFAVHSPQGPAGHVEDAIVDDQDWSLPYLIVDLTGHIDHRRVLLPTHLVDRIEHHHRSLAVQCPRRRILDSPPYDPDSLITESDRQLIAEHHEAHSEDR